MLTIDWVSGAGRNSRCPVCHADGYKRHVLDAGFSIAGGAAGQRVALLECGVCGARYSDPALAVDYHDVDQEGVDYYVQQGAGIDVMLDMFGLLDGRPIERYLDVGCSFGFAMEYALRSLGWEVLGFDPGFVAAAGRRMLGLPIESRLLDRDAVPRGAFDVVFCSEVIEHIREPDPFVDILRHALSDDGVLLLTTPDGDAVSPHLPNAMLAPVLSPGQHVILYNARSIETLLRRHGFTDVRVHGNATQLRVVAAMTRLGEPASYFTRPRYRAFLRDELDAHTGNTALIAGFGYRLLCEEVYAGAFESAQAAYQRLRDAYRNAYGFDIEVSGAVPIPSAAGLSLGDIGKRMPFNLCGVWYCRGIIAFLGDRDPAAAADYFAAAIRVGSLLRAVLNTIGTDDISVANFCRESDVARLSALAQSDPAAAVRALHPQRQDAAHQAQLQRRLFVDLVNLGHLSFAELLVADHGPPVTLPISADATPMAKAYGIYLLNHLHNPGAASEMLAATRDAVLAGLAAQPGDAALLALLQDTEVALVTALAFVGHEEAAAAIEDISRNRAGLRAEAFAAHMAKLRVNATALFGDLGYPP